MLSYQHAYHAGGRADIHKHVALSLLLARLAEKDKAFVIIDLYAGHGVYDLSGAEAKKTGEFTGGIGRLWPPPQKKAPPAIATLFKDVAALNPDGILKFYPGSPALERAVLREDDRLILNELHPAAFSDLKRWARRDPRIAVHKRDGLEALGGLTPPAIRRGLVVIDPSYEIKTEYARVPEKLAKAVRKWAQGIYLVWYPILPEAPHRGLLAAASSIDADILACELVFEKHAPGLRGTGLLIVNPPWQFEEQMSEAGEWLTKAITAGGKHSAGWLKRKA